MAERQGAGVQQQAWRLAAYRRRCIQPVTQDAVSQRLHVHAQLVTAAGFGLQGDACGLVQWVMVQDAEASRAGFALAVIDFLARSVGPVADKREVNFARVRLDTAINHRNIVLAHLALLKQAIEETLYRFAQSDDHQP